MKSVFSSLITCIGKSIEKKKFEDAPIYIGGCGRSGTTLLLSVLSAHNEIFACPKELNLFENGEITTSKVRIPKFYRLYRTLIIKKIKKTAKRYCEKSPSNIRYVELIDAKHKGNFKMIQIIRDGRDVILSRHPRNKDEYWVDPDRWINDVSVGLNYMNHPNVHTIKYEELVNDYRNTMQGVCQFLGISFSSELSNWLEHTTVRKNNALFTSIKEINNSSVNKWKKPENSARVKQLTGNPEAIKLLRSLGYEY